MGKLLQSLFTSFNKGGSPKVAIIHVLRASICNPSRARGAEGLAGGAARAPRRGDRLGCLAWQIHKGGGPFIFGAILPDNIILTIYTDPRIIRICGEAPV